MWHFFACSMCALSSWPPCWSGHQVICNQCGSCAWAVRWVCTYCIHSLHSTLQHWGPCRNFSPASMSDGCLPVSIICLHCKGCRQVYSADVQGRKTKLVHQQHIHTLPLKSLLRGYTGLFLSFSCAISRNGMQMSARTLMSNFMSSRVSGRVHLYSLRNQAYVYSLKFNSRVLGLRCSPRLLVAALDAQLHAFDATSLSHVFSAVTYPAPCTHQLYQSENLCSGNGCGPRLGVPLARLCFQPGRFLIPEHAFISHPCRVTLFPDSIMIPDHAFHEPPVWTYLASRIP